MTTANYFLKLNLEHTTHLFLHHWHELVRWKRTKLFMFGISWVHLHAADLLTSTYLFPTLFFIMFRLFEGLYFPLILCLISCLTAYLNISFNKIPRLSTVYFFTCTYVRDVRDDWYKGISSDFLDFVQNCFGTRNRFAEANSCKMIYIGMPFYLQVWIIDGGQLSHDSQLAL